MHKFLVSFMLLGFALMLNACSTVGGVGKDIQKAGEAITDEAKETEAKL